MPCFVVHALSIVNSHNCVRAFCHQCTPLSLSLSLSFFPSLALSWSLAQAESRDLPEEASGGGQQVAAGLHPETQGSKSAAQTGSARFLLCSYIA